MKCPRCHEFIEYRVMPKPLDNCLNHLQVLFDDNPDMQPAIVV